MLNTVSAVKSYFFMIHFNINLLSIPRSSMHYISFSVSYKNCISFLFSYVYNMATPSYDIEVCFCKHIFSIISLLPFKLPARSAVQTVSSVSTTDNVSSNPICSLNEYPRFYVLSFVGTSLFVVRFQVPGPYLLTYSMQQSPS